MYINITDSAKADNKGSSAGLTNYLEKENRLYNKITPEYWFNHLQQDIEPFEIRHAIDHNIAKLGKDDAKFFLINISPSQKELRHLKERFGMDEVKDQLKIYAEKVMDEYARNFKRPGIDSCKDLLWFAKLENYRYYGFKDKEVLNGIKKRGERKEGEQLHIQIIVSRKDMTNKIKLSPMNKSKGRNQAHSKKLGQFNRVAFKQSGETFFDEWFEFDRNLKETMAYVNVQKNGNLSQRMQCDTLEKGLQINPQMTGLAGEIVNNITNDLYVTTTSMLQSIGQTAGKFLDILLETPYEASQATNSIEEEIKRKKKKRKGQSQGISR